MEESRKKVAVGKELGKGLEWNGKKAENGGSHREDSGNESICRVAHRHTC